MAVGTGVLWPSFYTGDGSRIRKWLYGSVLVRDWDPAGSTNMTNLPVFAANGALNPLLLAPVSQGGYGFYDVGSITENGVEFTPKFNADETHIWQSRRSQRTDITMDDEEIMFSAADTTPLVDYLYYNLPIGFTGVPTFPTIGAQGYQIVKPYYSDTVYRQLLIIGVDGSVGPNGQPEYQVELRPRVTLAKKNKRSWGSKQIDVKELTYTVHVDPYSGWDSNTLRGGSVWFAEGGAVTLPSGISGTVPTVNTATVNAPVISGVPSTTGGSLAIGTYYWVVTATTALGETTASNEITATTTTATSQNVVSWTAVPGATGYKLYRGTAAGVENKLINTIGSGATVTSTDSGAAGTTASPPTTNTAAIAVPTSVTATALAANVAGAPGENLGDGTALYYKVTALTANGETSPSAEVTLTPTANQAVTVGFGAVTGATGYKIYRGTSAGGENVLVTLPSAGASATSFTDCGSTVVATAVTGSKANLVFNVPTVPLGTYTYTVTQTIVGSGVFTASTVASTTLPTVAAAGGAATIQVSGLTASTVYQFQIVATAPSGLFASYPLSNSITST